MLLLHNPWHQIVAYITYDIISHITKNYLYYSASSKKYIICEGRANNYEWLRCYLRFMSNERQTNQSHQFFVIFANLQKFTELILLKGDFGG